MDLIVTTGGLGPTADDMTVEIVSRFCGRPLVLDEAMEARIADAPRAQEIVVAVVVTDSGRPLPRIGGLQVHEIKGTDGLR